MIDQGALTVTCSECGAAEAIDNPGQPPVEWVCENGHTNTWEP